MHRGAWGFAVVATCASLTACGAATVARNAAAVPATSAAAEPSSAATAPATALPLPSPRVEPPGPPLLIVRQTNVIEAIDAAGTIHWSFNLDPVVGKGNGDSTGVVTGGSHLLLQSDTGVTVIDRNGHVIGHGSAVKSAALPSAPGINPDPTGTRWAFSTIDSGPRTSSDPNVTEAPQWTGAVWVAGIDEKPHRVMNWTEPSETSVDVFQWSDRGIVTAVVPGACAPTPQETSTAILDPATGRSTPLEGGDRHVVDVHAGLVLAMRQPETLLVTGAHTATLTEHPVTDGEHLAAAAISPDGRLVFGSMTAMGGCGGHPEVRTAVLDPTTQHETVLRGVFAVDWFDNAHLVVHPAANSLELHVVDLDGHDLSGVLTHGEEIGVLR